MSKAPVSRTSSTTSRGPLRGEATFGGIISLLSPLLVMTSIAAWLLPADLIQFWLGLSTNAQTFAEFESAGRVEFFWWALRWLAPIAAVVSITVGRRLHQTFASLTDATTMILALTQVSGESRWKTRSLRGLLIVWAGLFVWQSGWAIWKRSEEWPFYRLRSGQKVLPNISDSNRDVIRYLEAATPKTARIFVASDQKLFFLNYYLLPRRLFHRMHPDAEYVIPKEHQQRLMAAYRLSELDPAVIARTRPDYILEYFEHPEMVDRSRLYEDAEWIRFNQSRPRETPFVPTYLVSLKRYEPDQFSKPNPQNDNTLPEKNDVPPTSSGGRP